MILLCSCGGEEQGFRKETYPVTGQVFIDGQAAAEPIKVMCHHQQGMDQEHPTVSQALTGEEGKFEISTYESGDGVPAGDYVLTFYWGKQNLVAMRYGGPDKFKGRYADPKKSEFKFTVKEGEPTDLGRIDLSTK